MDPWELLGIYEWIHERVFHGYAPLVLAAGIP